MEEYVHNEGPIDEYLCDGYLAESCRRTDNKKTNLNLRTVHIHGHLHERRVSYKGRKVLVCRYVVKQDSRPSPYSIVPGRILSTVDEVSQVEPIANRTERQELTDLIRAMGIKGPINFWK